MSEFHHHAYNYYSQLATGEKAIVERNIYTHSHPDGSNPNHDHPIHDAFEKLMGLPSQSEWRLAKAGLIGKDS